MNIEDLESALVEIDIQKNPPSQEPQRQYYYIKTLREWYAAETAKKGRELTFSIAIMGCQMNARDSEKLVGILTAIGYKAADKEDGADLVIYNTCCVRENAEQKVYGRLGYLKSFKAKNPDMKIAMCGCMMQEESVLTKIQKSYRHVDLIFGTHNIYKFPELLHTLIESDGHVVDIWKEHQEIVEDLPSVRKQSFKASVNIMFGCNNFCTYCIVPYVRGRERSRKPEDIIREIRELAAEGVKEVQLLGQNVNSYGKNLETPVSFSQLLRMVSEVEGIERIRFMTSHPKDLSQELIDTMAALPKVCPHFHLPLQSGSSRLLKLMNRHYDQEQYLDIVKRLREAVPEISLTTDIIVGFPGETDADFEETLKVVRKARFDSAFTFIYSKREGTPAAVMEQVPEEESKAHFDTLLKVMQEVIDENNKVLIGRHVKVLAEEVSKNDPSMLSGRTETNHLVHFVADRSLIGQIVDVQIEESMTYYLAGRLLHTQCRNGGTR